MLNRSYILTIIMLRNRENNILSSIPKDLTNYIIHLGDIAYGPDSNIAKILHHIVYGNPDVVRKMLDVNPLLLCQTGDVISPSGNIILNKTPYECALGEGDEDITAMIKSYFLMIKNGINEEEKQYTKYKPYIENIHLQKTYDFNTLMDILLKSSAKDVTAALNLDMTHKSPLRDALISLREYFSPRMIKEGMHFNYLDLQNAYDTYEREFNNMKRPDSSCRRRYYFQSEAGYNYDRNDLFFRQIIGYI